MSYDFKLDYCTGGLGLPCGCRLCDAGVRKIAPESRIAVDVIQPDGSTKRMAWDISPAMYEKLQQIAASLQDDAGSDEISEEQECSHCGPPMDGILQAK